MSLDLSDANDLDEIRELLKRLLDQKASPPERPRGWRAWLAWLVGYGPRTAYEAALEAELDRQRSIALEARKREAEAVADRDASAAERAFERRRFEAEVDAAALENKLLGDIVARDRLRVQAEQAGSAITVGMAERGKGES